MANALREGMHVDACDGTRIGTVRRLFSAAARPGAAAEEDVTAGPEPGGEGELTQISEMPATYNIGSVGTTGYGTSQSAGLAPFPGGRDTDPAAATDSAEFTPSDTKYMEVHHGGLLGLGGESIYVPYSAVTAISETTVTLSCTKDEATERYAEAPSDIGE